MGLTRSWARASAAMLVTLLAVVTLGAGLAAAQPSTTPDPGSEQSQEDSTTYGFDPTCNELHDTVSQIPIVGTFGGDVASAVCKAGNVASHPGQALDATRSKLWDSTMGEVTEILLSGLGDALKLSTVWTALPNDAVLTGTGQDATLWTRVDDYTRQLQVWLLAISIAISAARIGIARQHMAAQHAEEAFRVMARAAASSWVAGAAILAAARVTDAFATWLIDDATGGSAQGAAELLVRTDRFASVSPGFVFVVALVGILGAAAMIVLQVIRQALLVVAVGVYPLAAAASGTTGGRQSFQKLGAWIIAFLLFKPVAALVYMIAFVTADQSNIDADAVVDPFDSAHRALVGIVLLCSAAFVLPALMRLIVPTLSVLGSGGSGAAATGAVVGAAIATGVGIKAAAAGGLGGGMQTPTGPPPPSGGNPTGHRHLGSPQRSLGGGGAAGLPAGSRGGGGGGGGGGRPGGAAPGGGGAGASGAAGSGAGRAARGATRAIGAGRGADQFGEDATGGADATGSAPYNPRNGGFDITR